MGGGSRAVTKRSGHDIPISGFLSKLTFSIETFLFRVGANVNIYMVKWGLGRLAWKSRISYISFYQQCLKNVNPVEFMDIKAEA